MQNHQSKDERIDYIEMYVPVAKPVVYWHQKALGFTAVAYAGIETGKPGLASYLLRSGNISLVVTATYPLYSGNVMGEISSFVNANSCGVRRIAFHVPFVKAAFDAGVGNGGIPTKFPCKIEDEYGYVEEAAIKLYDNSEVLFINRDNYHGIFRPGFKKVAPQAEQVPALFSSVDHIASELRINEADRWTDYLSRTIGSRLIQKVERGEENTTGMIMNISMAGMEKSIFVMTESEAHDPSSRVQQSVEKFGPGVHHIAFSTDDIVGTITKLRAHNVELVNFPASYYAMLRDNEALKDMDIDSLQEQGILVDKEGDTYLLQKFIKPMGDRPYFFYEIIQRVNGYSGFALKNIAALRKAEELQITQVANA
jgi:4-hydroxyphenylpyruvate dioxygenase